MKNLIAVVLGVLTLYQLKGQNLIPNPSFENYTSCPSNTGQIDSCLSWYSPTKGTTDYCHQCNSASAGVPNNQWGYQPARTGNAYAHVICYYPAIALDNYCEHIQVKFSSPLVKNRMYDVVFYVSRSHNRYGIDAIGAYISDTAWAHRKAFPINPPVLPQISNPSGNMLLDTAQWVPISGEYLAKGGEQYISIGNFKDYNNFLVHDFGTPGSVASYFIDDVSVTLSPNIWLSGDTTLCSNDSISLVAFNSTSYTWVDSVMPNMVISTDSIIRVKPDSTTTYFCYGSQNDTASVTVTIVDSDFPGLGNDTILCEGESVFFDATTSNATYLWQDDSKNPTFMAQGEGVYWVEVTVGGCVFADSIQVSTVRSRFKDLGEDTTICRGESILLDAAARNAEYIWQDNSTDSTFKLTEPGIYWVEVITENCWFTDSILVKQGDCKIVLQMPNVFTPNNDQVNDLFAPTVSKGIISMHTTIFNRWGIKVYETTDPKINWKAENVTEGVYFWTILYRDERGNEKHASDCLTLFR
jgi:gliding motility-associated-like protein